MWKPVVFVYINKGQVVKAIDFSTQIEKLQKSFKEPN